MTNEDGTDYSAQTNLSSTLNNTVLPFSKNYSLYIAQWCDCYLIKEKISLKQKIEKWRALIYISYLFL